MDLSLINPKEHRQLFLDDYAIETGSGFQNHGWKRNLHPPKKCGPVIRPDQSRGQTSLQSRSVPQWNSEKEIWEWWYFGEHVYYATSTDGENWERPSLGLFDWRDSRDNNIACDPNGPRSHHIVRDEGDEDPERRYKGLFTYKGLTPDGIHSIGSDRYLGVSPDGFHWVILDVPPIPSSDEAHFTYDEISRQYLATVKHGTEWGRSVFLSTSEDFIHFTEPKLIFHSDEIDRQNRRQRVREVIENPAYITPPIIDDTDYIAEVYQMAVMPYEGVYLGFPAIFNPFGAIPPPEKNFTRINQVELTFSRDLYHWDRLADRALFIAIDPWDGESYGTSQILLCGRPIVRQDLGEIWVYYNALRMPGGMENYRDLNRNKELFRLDVAPELFDDRGALSLAKLKTDRFVSLDADEAGTITTKPFMLKGEDLYINADARWGAIYTEIVDAETMSLLAGFYVPGEQHPPFTGDSVRAKVAWKHRHELVFEKPVRLIFDLHQARLYSFWLE